MSVRGKRPWWARFSLSRRPHCTTCSATAKIKPTPNTIAAMMMPWTNGCIARFAGFDLALALFVAAWQWRQQRQDHDH
jgi:hypothetical protein